MSHFTVLNAISSSTNGGSPQNPEDPKEPTNAA